MFSLFKTSIVDSSLLSGAVDNHSHILYGVDDGVSTLEESLELLAWLEEHGLKELWLTPHIMEDVPNTTEALKKRYAELKAAYKGKIILQLAAEYMMDYNFASRLRERDLLEHGKGRVLVETSVVAPPMEFWEMLSQMIALGYTPILAHPERYFYMTEDDYVRLREMGVLFQLNLPSIVGFYGPLVKEKARRMLEKGWYCMAGSDCHNLKRLTRQFEDSPLSKKSLKFIRPLLSV